MEVLQTNITYLKGVGPERAKLLEEELGIKTFNDLLHHFPFRYIDRTQFNTIAELPEIYQQPVQLKGVITGLNVSGNGRKKALKAVFKDATGSIELVWFKGIKWIMDSLKTNQVYEIYGKVQRYGGVWNMAHPEMEKAEARKITRQFQPVYHSTEKLTKKGLHSKGIEKLLQQLLIDVIGKIPESLSQEILATNKLLGINQAMKQIHLPEHLEEAKRARFRLKFEELFFLQLELLIRKNLRTKPEQGLPMPKVGEVFNTFYEYHLPFELTNAQKRVVKEVFQDMKRGIHMNRLIQGDVGSGKTLVALLNMLIAVGNGYQTALLAPTEILAQQHFETINAMLEPLNLKVALLTGSVKGKVRRLLFEALQNGEVHILIGTHAIIEPKVMFQNLGLAVIDEQHRFGVAQRASLWKKNSRPPHVLVMTATPIPRTLAMSFYGDLDVSVIDELPPGRKPINTVHYFEKSRIKVFAFMKEQIALGRQVYVVYPLIEESSVLDYQNLMSGFEAIQRAFPPPQFHVSIVHGKMKAEDKDFEMQRFVKGETHIMVATTVIEVGVNVPNASVMVIESAEKFGLSQLHQLRGRVGRGAEQSYCILMTGDKISKEGKRRLQTMVQTNDGFKIAEVDLEIRGPGDIMGTQQSGLLQLSIANLATDGPIISLARDAARKLLEIDERLTENKHFPLKHKLQSIIKNKPNWSKIS
ncbi:MAG: ATP-dependent DNA helicase RecG [Crocinitomicaceae bacterium]|nr:ATP-dependent DNA helicase RecG [Crocinitomicaceae bacterium]